MDVYLPVDFYSLRDDLPDWRDTHATDSGVDQAHRETTHATDTDAPNACADPLWRVF